MQSSHALACISIDRYCFDTEGQTKSSTEMLIHGTNLSVPQVANSCKVALDAER